MVNCFNDQRDKKINMKPTSVIFILIATLCGSHARASVVYSENFSSDPGYTSLDPSQAYWDPIEGNYYAKVTDVSSGYGYDVGISRAFTRVENTTFDINFDFNIITPVYGNYPGINFVDSTIANPEDRYASSSLFFDFTRSDTVYNKFGVGPLPYSERYSGSVTNFDNWYHVSLHFDNPDKLLSWTITDLSDNSLFYSKSGVPFDAKAFDQIMIGQITDPPKYGASPSDIRVDNIEVAVPGPASGLLLTVGLVLVGCFRRQRS